jgi:hypothetical protein
MKASSPIPRATPATAIKMPVSENPQNEGLMLALSGRSSQYENEQ